MEEKSNITPVLQKPPISEEELIKLFNSSEKVERTPRGAYKPVNKHEKKKDKK